MTRRITFFLAMLMATVATAFAAIEAAVSFAAM